MSAGLSLAAGRTTTRGRRRWRAEPVLYGLVQSESTAGGRGVVAELLERRGAGAHARSGANAADLANSAHDCRHSVNSA